MPKRRVNEEALVQSSVLSKRGRRVLWRFQPAPTYVALAHAAPRSSISASSASLSLMIPQTPSSASAATLSQAASGTRKVRWNVSLDKVESSRQLSKPHEYLSNCLKPEIQTGYPGEYVMTGKQYYVNLQITRGKSIVDESGNLALTDLQVVTSFYGRRHQRLGQ
jgi:hypothetical protein